MELIRHDINIPFDKLFKPVLTFSIIISLISFAIIGTKMFVTKTFNWGPDFAGGTEMQLKVNGTGPVDLSKIRAAVAAAGYGDPNVSEFGGAEAREVLVRLAETSSKDKGSVSSNVVKSLNTTMGEGTMTLLRVDEVGPKVGKDLKRNAVFALIIANLGILVYLWFRFTPEFAPGAVIATLHDLIIAWGAYTLMNFPFDLGTVAALLTIVGYSVNDTVIIYDRIREHMKKAKRSDFVGLVVKSLNETLSRTILTSTLTFMVVLAQFIFSKGSIRDFAFVLMIGIFVGTYSSLFIATPILIYLEKRRTA